MPAVAEMAAAVLRQMITQVEKMAATLARVVTAVRAELQQRALPAMVVQVVPLVRLATVVLLLREELLAVEVPQQQAASAVLVVQVQLLAVTAVLVDFRSVQLVVLAVLAARRPMAQVV
jgi:hypothetical protein